MEKDYKIEIREVLFKDNHLKIRWIASIGFGEFDLFATNSEDENAKLLNLQEKTKFHAFTECLGEKFMKDLLSKTAEYLMKNSAIKE